MLFFLNTMWITVDVYVHLCQREENYMAWNFLTYTDTYKTISIAKLFRPSPPPNSEPVFIPKNRFPAWRTVTTDNPIWCTGPPGNTGIDSWTPETFTNKDSDCSCYLLVLKPNSWTYNFVEISGPNLKSSQILDFHIQSLHYKPVSNHFCSRGRGGMTRDPRGGWLWIARRKIIRLLSLLRPRIRPLL